VDDGETSWRVRASDGGETGGYLSAEAPGLIEIELDCMARSRWERRQKSEWQMADQTAELRAIRAVPGNDRIKEDEPGEHIVGVKNADPIKSSRNNGLGRVSEAGEGYILLRAPNLRIIGPKGFKGGKTEDEIPDCTRANQKPSQVNHLL
jgi:hypothetical protein